MRIFLGLPWHLLSILAHWLRKNHHLLNYKDAFGYIVASGEGSGNYSGVSDDSPWLTVPGVQSNTNAHGWESFWSVKNKPLSSEKIVIYGQVMQSISITTMLTIFFSLKNMQTNQKRHFSCV